MFIEIRDNRQGKVILNTDYIKSVVEMRGNSEPMCSISMATKDSSGYDESYVALISYKELRKYLNELPRN